MMTVELHLQALDVWCEHDASPPSDQLNIDSKQKRRLSQLAKYALGIRQVLANQTDLSQVDYILWCSEYGDEHKTLAILNDIAAGDTPSPTAFATSVHNATAGLYSMLYQDNTPSSSLNVGIHDFTAALLYAHALLKSAAATVVLVVCTDECLPESYHPHELEQAFAMGCVVRVVDMDHPVNLTMTHTAHAVANQDKRPEAVQFALFWQQQPTLQLGSWLLCKPC